MMLVLIYTLAVLCLAGGLDAASFQAENAVLVPDHSIQPQASVRSEDLEDEEERFGPENLLYSESEPGPSHTSSVSVHVNEEDESHSCVVTLQTADCANKNLEEIPQDLPTNITVLFLNNNNISRLPDYVFARYSSLRQLDLSWNNISSLDDQSFANLSSLHWLSLHRNLLLLAPSVYPDTVFCPLENLTYLDISHNTKEVNRPFLQYPELALSCLTELRSLLMDGLPMTYDPPSFGTGFKSLTKLSKLALRGRKRYYCSLERLYCNSFNNLPYLEHLTISNCNIIGSAISDKTFLPLTKLRMLDISGNTKINADHLDGLFYGLCQLENLTKLNIGSVVDRYSVSLCIGVSTFKYFPQHLIEFNAEANNLEAVGENVIDKLSPSLTTLVLNSNRFTFGAYLKHLHKLTKLENLYLNGFKDFYGLPTTYPFDTGLHGHTQSNCTTFSREEYPFVLVLPPKLRYVEMNNAGLGYVLTSLVVFKPNSLRSLSLYGNHFPKLLGPVYGLESLTLLNVSSCYIHEISHRFFKRFPSLEELRLDSNMLGPYLSNHRNRKVFSALKGLKSLNLSSNYIMILPSEIFHSLTSLTHLYLDQNPLVQFDANLDSITSLTVLVLFETSVATLPISTQIYFDVLVNTTGVNVSIDMENTPISCDCFNLHFLQWMTTSDAFSKHFHNYFCGTVDSGRRLITDDYQEIISILRKQCPNNNILFFLVASATIAITTVIIIVIIYRFRWNIRYMYYAAYLRSKKISNPSGMAHEYDAFISYASEDAEFAEGTLDRQLSARGLRIFLHGRDFKAGDYVSSNIVNAVCSSKKTVVLLTKALLDSYWCGYEIEMAKLEGVHSGRPVLIFVFLEEIPQEQLSRNLLYNIKNNTYLEYMASTSDPDQMKLWWDKIASDIKD